MRSLPREPEKKSRSKLNTLDHGPLHRCRALLSVPIDGAALSGRDLRPWHRAAQSAVFRARTPEYNLHDMSSSVEGFQAVGYPLVRRNISQA